jgi:hypothetical protein
MYIPLTTDAHDRNAVRLFLNGRLVTEVCADQTQDAAPWWPQWTASRASRRWCSCYGAVVCARCHPPPKATAVAEGEGDAAAQDHIP